MPDSASIGANFSDYQGNAGLGNVGLGAIQIDTRPLEQLAHYTFIYKKNLWEQKQKETDAKVAELADLSNISLNDLRGHDKEQATKEFSDLLSYASEYARKDPKTAEERIQNELEWQTKYGAFKNNFGSGKARATSYYAHVNTIKQNITDATTQDEAIRQLNKTFDETDISTPISAVPNFKIEKFDIPDPVSQKFNAVAILGNDNLDIEGSIYNPKLNAGVADATILGIGNAYPKKGTKEYDALSENEKNQVAIQSTITSSGKGWIDATEPLNTVLKKYINSEGKFDADSFENDNASNTVLMNPYNALKKYDSDNRDRYNQALNGYFTDKGLSIPLPANVNPNDFKAGFVDFAKGINANQLVQSGMYAKYTGDVFNKKVTHTGEANDLKKANIAASTQRRGQNLDFEAKKLDLIGKGWTLNKKGKLQPPTNNSATSTANGGIVPYWQNYITPQIEAGAKKFSIATGIKTDKLKTFNGDLEINTSDISGLSIALFGEAGAGGQQKSIIGEDITKGVDVIPKTTVKLRFENGNPIGVVIDGVFYDQNDINSKATRMQDKIITNKLDAPIFGTEPQQTLTDAEKYLQSIKK